MNKIVIVLAGDTFAPELHLLQQDLLIALVDRLLMFLKRFRNPKKQEI